jgi:hypothetical protein
VTISKHFDEIVAWRANYPRRDRLSDPSSVVNNWRRAMRAKAAAEGNVMMGSTGGARHLRNGIRALVVAASRVDPSKARKTLEVELRLWPHEERIPARYATWCVIAPGVTAAPATAARGQVVIYGAGLPPACFERIRLWGGTVPGVVSVFGEGSPHGSSTSDTDHLRICGESRVWQPDHLEMGAPFNVTVASVMRCRHLQRRGLER